MLLPRHVSLGAAMAVLVHGSVLAQSAAASTSPVCGQSHVFFGAVGGGVVGGFVGLVVSKIEISDWESGSRGSPAARVRTQYISGGAVVGALSGMLLTRGGGCYRRETIGAQAPARRATSEITLAEIQRVGATGSVYDLIASLRRNWLIVRGSNTGEYAGPAVYVNETRMESMTTLRELPAVGITSVRYYNASEASQRFGAGHMSGAIQVLTGAVGSGT